MWLNQQSTNDIDNKFIVCYIPNKTLYFCMPSVFIANARILMKILVPVKYTLWKHAKLNAQNQYIKYPVTTYNTYARIYVMGTGQMRIHYPPPAPSHLNIPSTILFISLFPNPLPQIYVIELRDDLEY